MPFVNTNDLTVWERLPGWRGRTLTSEKMTFSHWEFDAGSSIHEHWHPTEEIWFVVEGELEMTVDGKTQVAGPGVAAIVPLNAPHSARALTNGRAVVVDHPARVEESRG